MIKEEPMDFGGTPIDINDVISDDVICKIKGLNPDLGVEGRDPFYDKYSKHRDEIENAELIIIDANSLNRSSIMNLDLFGDIAGIEDLNADYFQLRDDSLELAYGIDEFDCDTGANEFDIFADEYSAFGDTEYCIESSGLYY